MTLTPEQIDVIREHQLSFKIEVDDENGALVGKCAWQMFHDIDILIAEIDAMQSKPTVEKPQGPLATRIDVDHCGRHLFVVEGKTGIWCSHRDYDEPDSEMIDARVDKPQRGRARRKTLYRLDGLSKRLLKLFGPKQE